jgi:uncharacterized membrane protein YhaH (DUF805 family)
MAEPQRAPFRFWSFFFSLNGRVSRVPFLVFELITRLGVLAGYQALRFVPGLSMNTLGLYTLPLGLITVIMFWPNFALLFKRFHDAGLSGLWALPYFAPAPYLVYVVYARLAAVGRHDMVAAQHVTSAYADWALAAIAWGLVLIAALLPSGKSANRYGPRAGYLPEPPLDMF